MGVSVRTMGNRGMITPMVPSPMMGGPMGQVLLPAPGIWDKLSLKAFPFLSCRPSLVMVVRAQYFFVRFHS